MRAPALTAMDGRRAGDDARRRACVAVGLGVVAMLLCWTVFGGIFFGTAACVVAHAVRVSRPEPRIRRASIAASLLGIVAGVAAIAMIPIEFTPTV
ncbi:hypothetical protein [Nocardia pseudobrasiliensis]|uniref:DUF4190 domain-containing protein n=1 Tax=Nocardia pseudobrasiliensis TaxID=45979 RepID=A0A370ICV8_9NOCA|nr:hypothetical protein [Nocardia pseudobrasiliensis]RDI67931.1 hypothetical protein DFR76_102332 [Nocardia pseudobrasiliensis]